ncbi:F-box protein, partial [Endozoicomonas sp. ONNA1]
MHGIDNNSCIAQSNTLPIRQAHPETASSCVSAGRSVAVPDKVKASLRNLSFLSFSRIFRYLGLRDIRSLEQVCTFLNRAVKEDNALAKAWYRRFSSPHQTQLKMSITAKNEDQLRDWLNSFTKDETLLASFKDCKKESVYFPAL